MRGYFPSAFEGDACHGDKKHAGYLFNRIIVTVFGDKNQILVAEWIAQGKGKSSTIF